jgi:tRNA A37 threonylcarbamoyltransferase TsaD
MIPLDFYDGLYKEGVSPGYFIELLGKYGDPSEYVFPIGLRNETNADFSLTGVKTSV